MNIKYLKSLKIFLWNSKKLGVRKKVIMITKLSKNYSNKSNNKYLELMYSNSGLNYESSKI